MGRKDWNGNGHSVKVNIKLLFFGGVKCRFWANQSSPYHQTGDCESFSVNQPSMVIRQL